MENEVKPVDTQQPTGPATPATPVAQEQPAQASKAVNPDRTFTRDEVTQIVKARQDRFSNGLCKKFGVTSIKDLEDLYTKHKDYDDIVAERDGLKTSHAEMSERLAFLSNGIDEKRYDDIRTYFKGKGLSFDEAVLKEHLKTHPEWAKQVAQTKPAITISKIGSAAQSSPTETEEMRANRIFGKI